tara:strand:- start:3050 stop:3322 length:273 start_codon:yes stop_codon:yes gene_type:complete
MVDLGNVLYYPKVAVVAVASGILGGLEWSYACDRKVTRLNAERTLRDVLGDEEAEEILNGARSTAIVRDTSTLGDYVSGYFKMLKPEKPN